MLYKKKLSQSIVKIKSTNRRVCGLKLLSKGNFSCFFCFFTRKILFEKSSKTYSYINIYR